MMRSRGQGGFSILESLVALLIAGVILGAAFELFVDDAKAYHTQTMVSEMRQNARSGLEFMVRDLLNSGYGLKYARPEVPVVVANEPGNLGAFSASAITVLMNTTDVTSALSDPMPQPSAELKVVESDGFITGRRAFIWDRTGSYEWFVITHVQNSDHLQHNLGPLSKSYTPTDGTEVAMIDEISYRYNAAELRIERMENAGPWITVSENVELLTFRYWNEAGTEIFPADNAARRSIRRIGVTLRTRTQQMDQTVRPARFRTFLLRSDVTPRNLEALPAT